LHKDLSGFENLVEETIDLEMVEEGIFGHVSFAKFVQNIEQITSKNIIILQ
jgi:hypothetical protein